MTLFTDASSVPSDEEGTTLSGNGSIQPGQWNNRNAPSNRVRLSSHSLNTVKIELLLGDEIEILINLNNRDIKQVKESKDHKRTEKSTFKLQNCCENFIINFTNIYVSLMDFQEI